MSIHKPVDTLYTCHRKWIAKSKHRKRVFQSYVVLSAGASVLASLSTSFAFLSREPPQPKRTSKMKGGIYIKELLAGEHECRIQEVLRMKLKPFKTLCSIMRKEELLSDSRHIDVEEQLAMFLHVVGRATSFRDVEERYQHSGETVFRYFQAVLNAFTALIPLYIKLPSNDIPLAISRSTKNYPFFADCIGAVDGTHIAAKVPTEEMALFRNRKGFLSQNVMACCDLDNLVFTYVLAGFEGSAHDGLVFNTAFNHGFSVPTGKYYLGDAGYPLTPYCLTPYRGVRYHLNEWQKGNQRY
jgi:DDE superfamily endonuclease